MIVTQSRIKTKPPVWKNVRFSKLAGLSDSLFRKIQISRTSQDEEALVHSGRFVRIQHRFHKYEAAAEENLLRTLMPMEEEARRLLVICNKPLPECTNVTALTSANLRMARASMAHRQQAMEEITESRLQLSQLLAQICFERNICESQLQQSFSSANEELAKYAKASRFSVVEREIPTLTRTFFPKQLSDSQLKLLNDIQRTLEEGAS